MLIEKLKITDHPAIGTVELDFRDTAGLPARTVIIAGSNGVGKTVVLDALHSLFSGEVVSQVDADIIFDQEESEYISKTTKMLSGLEPQQRLHIQRTPRSNLSAIVPGLFDGAPFVLLHQPHRLMLRTFFSDANVMYPKNPVQRLEPNQLDREGLQAMRAGNAQGIEIPNLLAALRQADLEERQVYEEEHPGQPLPVGLGNRRLDRFRKIYASMMPHKGFRTIRQVPGQYQIVFHGNGVETLIHDLSTGEKQIVFRAGFFIRDAGVMQKNVILIDEPELSLSPDWQAKILDFYANALSLEGAAHPQIICATHSPFIVHSANAGKVIVLERDANGLVQAMPDPIFPQASPAVAVRAFNLDRFVREAQPDKMAIITEGKTDVAIIEAAWTALYPGQPIPFTLHPGTGAKGLTSALNGPALSAMTQVGRVVGLFDFDHEGFDQWNGVWPQTSCPSDGDAARGILKRHRDAAAWAMLLPVPPFRSSIAGSHLGSRSRLQIEFMFPSEVIPRDMLDLESQPGGGELEVFLSGCKVRFAEVVRGFPAEHFKGFRPLFDRFQAILAGTV